MNNKVELLAPAGNLEKAKLAIDFGADAVFIGGKGYSLRSRASNFTFDDMENICKYAHERNRKVYVATNVVCHNNLLKGFKSYVKKLEECGVDGLICADPFIIEQTLENTKMEVHISTQQSITNSKCAKFWKENGSNRVVLAREVSFEELELLMKNNNDLVEIEYFVHGAVCIAYSGRCMMSNHFSLRDANVGGCAHSCRWSYDFINKEGQKASDKKFTMSAKDNSLLKFLPKLIKLGISSFKIEGRMKSLHYVATIVNSYRKVIDETYKGQEFNDYWDKESQKAANRKTGSSWFEGSPKTDQMLYHEIQEQARQEFAFQVLEKIEDGKYKILCRNNFNTSMKFEAFGPATNGINVDTEITKIIDDSGAEVTVANKPMKEYIVITKSVLNVKDIARIVSV